MDVFKQQCRNILGVSNKNENINLLNNPQGGPGRAAFASSSPSALPHHHQRTPVVDEHTNHYYQNNNNFFYPTEELERTTFQDNTQQSQELESGNLSSRRQDASKIYTNDVLDIVTAYKSLKLSMSKNTKGINKGREICVGKGYLKPTVASRQAKRVTLGYAPLTLSTLNQPDNLTQLPNITRGSTAPAGA